MVVQATFGVDTAFSDVLFDPDGLFSDLIPTEKIQIKNEILTKYGINSKAVW